MELAVPAVRNLGWAGVDYRERRVMFGVRKVCSFEQDGPPFWRYSPAENMAYASIYHLSPKYLPYYLEFLRSYQPAIVMGYPSSLHTIAGYAVDSNDYPAPSKAILTTSETVTDSARTIIQSAWKCRIYDRYGAVEGCLFASQCEYGHYHVSPEVGIIEIINQQGQAASNGELGMVVCTGLQNTLQPLIRYQIGDMARWALDQNCECGRDMPILEGVEGRFEDICYTADGRALLRFDTVFKGIDSIREAQVVQEHIDLFTIIVVPGNGFNSHVVEQIQDNMSLHVGSVKTNIDIVDSIPRTSSGKFRAVICRLNEEEKLMVKSAQ
jgi:phenylacetate-CoA ligase